MFNLKAPQNIGIPRLLKTASRATFANYWRLAESQPRSRCQRRAYSVYRKTGDGVLCQELSGRTGILVCCTAREARTLDFRDAVYLGQLDC